VPNQIEFVVGLNPLAPDSFGLPTGTVESNQFVFRFVHDKTSAGTFVVQQSTDLLAWTHWPRRSRRSMPRPKR